MASSPRIKAGEAFIVIKAIDAASPVLDRISKKFTAVGRGVRNFGLAFGAVGAVITGAFIKPIKIASDITEQQNKFFQIFGSKVGKDVEARMKSLGQETGRTYLKMYKFAGAFGGLLKGQGATTDFAASMTKSLLSMGVDFSSFNDIMDDTREGSMRRFVSALSGSAEVLDQYGVAAKESALGPALEQMFGKGVRGATELEKSTARAYLIFKSMKQQNALGDAPRTMNELANLTRNFKDQLYEAMYFVGKQLLPIVGALMQYMLRLAIYASQWAQANRNIIIIVALIGAGFLVVGSIITVIGALIMGAGIAAAMLAKVLVVVKAISMAIAAVWAFITGNFMAILIVIAAILAVVLMFVFLGTQLVNIFSKFFSWVVWIGKAIWEAFATGRFELAWKLFFNSLKMGWEYVVMSVQKASAAVTNALINAFLTVKTFLMTTFDAIWVGFLAMFRSAQAGVLDGIQAIVRAMAGMAKKAGFAEKGNILSGFAQVLEEDAKGLRAKNTTEKAALKQRHAERKQYDKEFMGHTRQITEAWWKDNERNIEELKKKELELTKEIYKPEEFKEIIPNEPEAGAGKNTLTNSLKYSMPTAMERGTIAATKAAKGNAQSLALNNLVALAEEADSDRKTNNALLAEMFNRTGGV